MTRQQFSTEFGEFLSLNSKTWDIPKFGIINYNPANPYNAYVQVSLKGEIDMDSLYYVIGGNIYELDIAFLRPDLLDKSRYSITEMERGFKGKLNFIKVPFKYLIKHDIANMNKKKEEKLVTEVMTDEAMNNLMQSWKVIETMNGEDFKNKFIAAIPKEPMMITTSSKKLNRLLTTEDFTIALEEHLEKIKNDLLAKREKFSPDNWDNLFRKTAMRKQKSVLSVCDGFLDKDLERYYDLLNLLAQNDNISQDIKENQELQNEVEDVFNNLNNWFILQKFQMLKQIRAKI